MIHTLIRRFLDAENRRDWAAYADCLAEDVEWICYGAPHQVIRGRHDYLAAMKHAYANWPATFTIERLIVDERQGVAVAELVIEGRRSVDIFEVENGRIAREREYFDDAYWHSHSHGQGDRKG